MDQKHEISDSNKLVELVIRFNDALNAHDVQQMMSYLTDDTIFENTYPPPEGSRFEGRLAVTFFWEDFFRFDHEQNIAIEEIFACAGRCVMRWIYRWTDNGVSGYIRGVDIYTFQDGKISAKYSYVKG